MNDSKPVIDGATFSATRVWKVAQLCIAKSHKLFIVDVPRMSYLVDVDATATIMFHRTLLACVMCCGNYATT